MSATALNRLNGVARAALVGGAVLGGLQSALYDVDVGHRVVMYNRFANPAIEEKVRGEGTGFLIPWVQNPFHYDIRLTPREYPTQTGTKDLQTVKITLRVLVQPDEESLPKIHRELGQNWHDSVLPSICNEVLKGIVAEYNAEQLLVQREQVADGIRVALARRCKDFDILLRDVSITHLTFGPEFAKAIEAKQVASQDAERAKFIVEKTEFEKQATVIRAGGEAESAEILTKAIAESGVGLIEMRRIEAAKDIAETLARSRNITYLPSGQSVLMNLNAK
jgi:prohibitin 1